jgi:predicted DCC family thiol-disulfide oxidoreductase YuxK
MRFAPLSGKTFTERFSDRERAKFPDSVVLVKANGEIILRSDAILYVLSRSGKFWRIFSIIGKLFPRVIRDSAYDVVGRYRRYFFAQPSGICPIVPLELSDRFLE